MTLLCVVVLGEELAGEAIGFVVADSGRVHELVGGRHGFEREHEDRRGDGASGRHDDPGEDPLEIVVGHEVADGLLEPFEARGQHLETRFEVFGFGAGVVGEPADPVLAGGSAVARACLFEDLGAQPEQPGDVRVEPRGPRAVFAERREAVREPLAHDPFGRPGFAPLERDHGCEPGAARLADHAEQRFGRTERLQHRRHLGHRGIGEPSSRGALQRVGAVRRGGHLEQAPELVVGAPRSDVEQVVLAAGVAGVAKDARGRVRALVFAEIANQEPGVQAREMEPRRLISVTFHSQSSRQLRTAA